MGSLGVNGASNGTSSSSFTFSAKNLPKKLYIDNQYVAAKSDKTLSVYNPKDNSLVADDVPVAGQADVDAAVEAAERAFPAWKKFTAAARRDVLYKFAALLEQHTEALAELTRITLGAPYGAFGKFEIGLASEVMDSLTPSSL
jgi:aldehyde dehydrogenase (NAD+)